MNVPLKLALIIPALVIGGIVGIYALPYRYAAGGLTLMLIFGGITLFVLLVSGFIWLTVGSPWQSQEILPSRPPPRASELLDKARSTQASGIDAESLYREALEEARRALGSNSPELLPFIYGYLGTIMFRTDFAREAVDLSADGLRIVEQAAPTLENLEIALDCAAAAFSGWGRFRTAASLWSRLVTILEQHDAEPAAVAPRLASLAEVQEAHGQPEVALETVDKSLSLGLTEPLQEIMAHNTRGIALIDLSHYQAAIDEFQRTLRLLETKDIDGVDTIRSLITANLSVAHRYLGDLEEAAEFGARARRLAEGSFDDVHPSWATLDFNDGELRKLMGDFDGALDAHTRALHLRQKVLFEEHKDLARSMVALAEVKLAQGSADEATELATTAIHRVASLLTTDHPLIAKAQAVIEGRTSTVKSNHSAYR